MSVKSKVIDLPCGPIRANLDDDGMLYARGIKYADFKRFQKPAPLSPWTEIRDCTQPGRICPQLPSRLEIVNGPIEQGRTQDEDCLELSITAPAGGKDLPVMVFFHGGGYMSGGGDFDVYSPKPIARHGHVVGVSVTHRLGVFGYIPNDAVGPANLGYLDQIEALRWVQANITAFGGNPDQVTIYGQSAGGDSVMCLLVTDIAKGLFHRAIMQSAPIGLRNEPNRKEMMAAASKIVTSFFSDHNNDVLAPSTKDLLGLQAKIAGSMAKEYGTVTAFAPAFGVYPLPPWSELEERIVSAAKTIPVFIGYTKDEGTVFHKLLLNHSADVFSDQLFKNGSDQFHRAINNEARPSALYRFNWYPKKSSELKAVHCIELPFLLGDWEAWKIAPMLQGENSSEIVEGLGIQMKNLWVAFAKGAELGSTVFEIDEKFTYSSIS